MMPVKATYKFLILAAFSLSSMVVISQSDKQQQLEERRQELNNEIKKINQLQAENKSKQKSQLSLIESYNYKISVLSNLIKVTNQQANLLTREINNNQNKITDLREELKQLKAAYADMIVKSYKSKNEQSRIMFLLSSDDFKQAYKRLQYIKQYSDHQKQQGEEIKTKTTELQEINKNLLKQQETKKKLIAENRQTQKTLEAERKEHQEIVAFINKNLSIYTSQIKSKQQEADRIEKQINNIIRAEMAKSRKKTGTVVSTSNASKFALTREEKILASNFTENKGKLPWPIDDNTSYVILKYGTQPHPINKSLTIKSNGVRIAAKKGSKARAVFNGEVTSVKVINNANAFVMIRHGNYITTYKNLKSVYVKEGDKVSTKQDIGEVFTSPNNGETILYFGIYKEVETQNPASWIYKM